MSISCWVLYAAAVQRPLLLSSLYPSVLFAGVHPRAILRLPVYPNLGFHRLPALADRTRLFHALANLVETPEPAVALAIAAAQAV